tara:strand:- start:1641 stop:1742 length:102 start_codon:yes stop_codon:yes gene_type:complete
MELVALVVVKLAAVSMELAQTAGRASMVGQAPA